MPKLRTFSLLVCVALAPLTLSSCTHVMALVPPEASLVDVRVSDMTVLETQADFIIRLTNENADPVTVAGAVYEIEADGHRIGKGVSGSRFQIAPFSTGLDQVRINLSNLRMATRWVSLIEHGKLRYKIDAKLHLETAKGSGTFRSSNSGELDFDDAAGPRHQD